MSSTAHEPLPFESSALLCALILAPQVFSRNRFFALYKHPDAQRARRRAARVRSVVRQLLGRGDVTAEVIGEQILEDGQVLLQYRIPELHFERTTALTELEAAALRVAVARGRNTAPEASDLELVESKLHALASHLPFPLQSASEETASLPPTESS